MEDGTSKNTHVKSTKIVTEFIGKKANNWRCNKDTKWEDCVHEGNVNVVDANILHVNSKVGHDCEGSSVEEKQGELQGKEVHVRIKKFLRV